MDGVRRVPGGAASAVRLAPAPVPARASRPTAKPISAATSRANSGVRYVTGMDGVRRPLVAAPRTVSAPQVAAVPRPEAPLPSPAPRFDAPALAGVGGAAVLAQPTGRQLPALRWPAFEWKRPAIAFGLVATALIASGLAVRAVASPRSTTAHAETVQLAPSTKPSIAPVASVAPQKTGLQNLLNNFVAANPDKWGIYIKDLSTGETATYKADRQIESASLYKLFVAQRIFQRIDIGQLSYTTPAGGGSGKNIKDCLTVMINISDNTCGRTLGAILGWGAQNQALGLEGYQQTDLATPQQTSAQDVAKLLERLYRGTLVSADSGARFMALLKDQRVNNRLPVGLPAHTVIAHKTGDLDGYVHDAGIVYGGKTDYLVVVTSGPWGAPGNAPAQFAGLSQQLWNYFEQ
jgi:beta-lactamase class A